MDAVRTTDTPLTQEEVTDWLRVLRANAHTPESHFAVSAILHAKAGDKHYYFAGVNVENVDHPLSMHAEGSAMGAMMTTLGKYARFDEGWVMGGPEAVVQDDGTPASAMAITCCGGCRQRLMGVATPNATMHSVPINGRNVTTEAVSKLLPNAFTFEMIDPAIAEEAARHSAQPGGDETRLIRSGPLSETEIKEWLQSLQPVDFASKQSQAVVLRLSNGKYVAGVRVEEAAYSGINAVQAALGIATTAFGQPQVERVWVYSSGREGKEIPADNYLPLPLSAMQALGEFSDRERPPGVIYVAKEEGSRVMAFMRAVLHLPNSQKPYSSMEGLSVA